MKRKKPLSATTLRPSFKIPPPKLKAVSSNRVWWPIVLLAGVVLVVFGPTLGFEFLTWDDDVNVTNNPFYNPPSLGSILYFWTGEYTSFYIPMSYFSWGLIAWLSPKNPESAILFPAWPFHLANVVLHLLNSVLVFRLLKWFLPAGALVAAALGAVLFSVHPLQVETVAWVSGFRDLLSAGLLLGALSLLVTGLGGAEAAKAGGEGAVFAKRTAIWATALFVLSLLSKPAAVIAPALALLLIVGREWLARREGEGWSLKAWLSQWGRTPQARVLAVWFAIGLGWSAMASYLQPSSLLPYVTPLWARPLVAGDAIAFYLGKWFAPLNLGPDYGRSPEWLLAQPWMWATALVPVVLAAGLWGLRPVRPYLLALALFVVGLAPVLGFVPFVFQYYSTVADRYVYIAALGPALGLAWFVARAPRVWAPAAVVLTAWGSLAFLQTGVWHDSMSLYKHAQKVNPRSNVAIENIGMLLLGQGQLDGAMEQFKKAAEINPRSEKAQNNIGYVHYLRGERELAFAHYQKARDLKPDFVPAYENMAQYHFEGLDLDKARAAYEQAIAIRPTAKAYNGMAVVHIKRNETEQALAYWRKALALSPRDPEANRNFGIYLLNKGKPAEAVDHLLEALPRLGAVDDLTGLARQMASARGSSVYDPNSALRLAEAICRKSGCTHPLHLQALGIAQAASGHGALGKSTLKKALTTAERAGLKHLADDTRATLATLQ